MQIVNELDMYLRHEKDPPLLKVLISLVHMYILKVANTPCPSSAQSCECGGASKGSALPPCVSDGAWAGTRARLPPYL